MEIITIINQKGGVGKTTIATNVAYSLAQRRKRTLIIDLDPQAHSTLLFMGNPPQHYIQDCLSGSCSIVNAAYKAIDAKGPVDNLEILPSSIKLAVVAEQVSGRVHREKILSRLLKLFKQNPPFDFDYVIIDCPPTLGVLALNGICAANKYIIPIDSSRYAIEGMKDLLAVISEAKEDEPYKYIIVKNKYDSRTSVTNNYIDEILFKEFLKNVAKTSIRRLEAINQSQINGEPIFSFDAKSKASEDFNALTEEVLNWR